MGRVGILGPRCDEIDNVARAVEADGGVPVVIDTGQSGWASDGLRMVLNGQSLDDIGVFYVKGIPLTLTIPDMGGEIAASNWRERYALERERHSLLHSTLRGLELDGRFFVNPVTRLELQIFKLHQSAVLSRADIIVPHCLGTDDREAARAFAEKHGTIAIKPLSSGKRVRRIKASDWREVRVGGPALAPVLLQEYVEGEEIRVYVLDGDPIAAFLIPRDGVADEREGMDETRRCVPSFAVLEVATRAAIALELVFAAVDICIATDGSIVVLDCDPSPTVGSVGKGNAIVERLAEFLVLRS